MAFDVNEFRTNLIGDGARPNLFEVQLQFPSFVTVGGLAGNQSRFFVKTAQMPGSTIGITPLFYFGREVKLAGIVIGGPTGSGKTELLRQLAQSGEQVIDLESLACHKGSVFGGLGVPVQPTQEQFENELALVWSEQKLSKLLYIEDESKKIGAVFIPEALWQLMRSSLVVFLQVEREKRLKRLCSEYGGYAPSQLQACVLRLEKKLGGLTAQKIIEALSTSDIFTASDLLLHYYDASYAYGLSKRAPDLTLNFELDGEVLEARLAALKATVEKNLCISR